MISGKKLLQGTRCHYVVVLAFADTSKLNTIISRAESTRGISIGNK